MNQDDMQGFTHAWSAAAEMQTGSKLSDVAIKMAFRVLCDLELSEVKSGLLTHCRKTRWMPTPADVLACVTGELPSNAALYGLAVDDATVMGRFIKSLFRGDLARLAERDGLQRTEMLRGRIETFWQRALIGDYTERELRMFVAAGLDPSGTLATGISGPRIAYRQGVADRCAQIEPEEQIEHKNTEMSEEQKTAGKAALASLMSTLCTPSVTGGES